MTHLNAIYEILFTSYLEFYPVIFVLSYKKFIHIELLLISQNLEKSSLPIQSKMALPSTNHFLSHPMT